MDPDAADVLASTLGAMYTELKETVTRTDFLDLKEVVAGLVEAQKRTEAQVGELVEAQKRTEARVGELAEAQKRTEARVGELTEAQKRTEARVDTLAISLQELAEAQKRTEAQVGELVEAQKRTEARVDTLAISLQELAEAQKRTEVRVGELVEAQKRTEQIARDALKQGELLGLRFGVLGQRWGENAEEAFRQGILEIVREAGYSVEHFRGQDPDGFLTNVPRSFDLDVLVRNGRTIVAEIKSNASRADVTEFARSVRLFEQQTGRKADKKIMVAVTIQSAAIERAQEFGVIVSTGFEGHL